jgi:hypothetical protein
VLTLEITEDLAMPKCITSNYQFAKVKTRKVEINFTGGDISSDGGLV